MSTTGFLYSGFSGCLFLQRSKLFASDVTGVNLHVKGHPCWTQSTKKIAQVYFELRWIHFHFESQPELGLSCQHSRCELLKNNCQLKIYNQVGCTLTPPPPMPALCAGRRSSRVTWENMCWSVANTAPLVLWSSLPWDTVAEEGKFIN